MSKVSLFPGWIVVPVLSSQETAFLRALNDAWIYGREKNTSNREL